MPSLSCIPPDPAYAFPSMPSETDAKEDPRSMYSHFLMSITSPLYSATLPRILSFLADADMNGVTTIPDDPAAEVA